jgi:hypothetical protein
LRAKTQRKQLRQVLRILSTIECHHFCFSQKSLITTNLATISRK